MKPTRLAVWVNIAVAVFSASFLVWRLTRGEPGWAAFWAVLLVANVSSAVWAERSFRRWRRQRTEHERYMQELRDRYEAIGRYAQARIDRLIGRRAGDFDG